MLELGEHEDQLSVALRELAPGDHAVQRGLAPAFDLRPVLLDGGVHVLTGGLDPVEVGDDGLVADGAFRGDPRLPIEAPQRRVLGARVRRELGENEAWDPVVPLRSARHCRGSVPTYETAKTGV